MCRLRVDVSFHLLWANAKEHACGIAWYECAQVRTRPPRWLPGGGESLAPRPRGAWRRRCPRRGCADGGAAVSRCSHLQLPGGTGCEAPFLVLIRRLRVFRAVSVTAGVPGPQVHGRWTAGGRAELRLCHRSPALASPPQLRLRSSRVGCSREPRLRCQRGWGPLVKAFGPFFNQVVGLLIVEFEEFFYVWGNSPLSDVSSANFSVSVFSIS